MAGLGAIRGMFGAVLLCAILALVFLIIGLIVPEWGTRQFKNNTDLNKKLDRVSKVGLFEASTSGKCATQECRDAWLDALDTLADPACVKLMQLVTKKADHAECSYFGKGYCRCPYPEDDYVIKNSAETPKSGGCKLLAEFDDYAADNEKEYNESVTSCHTTAVIMLIIAIILVFIAIVLALVGAITAKWILGIVGAILLCLALIFAVVGLIMGTSFAKQSNLKASGNHCGSSDSFNKFNDLLSDDFKQSHNNFATGPILVLVGIIFLLIAVILDCMVSGLAKKIHKVADIDGDGRIG